MLWQREISMFKSHLVSLIVFSAIVSVLMAFIKFDDRKAITRYAVKLFAYFIGSVFVVSWILHFI